MSNDSCSEVLLALISLNIDVYEEIITNMEVNVNTKRAYFYALPQLFLSLLLNVLIDEDRVAIRCYITTNYIFPFFKRAFVIKY